VLLCVTACCVAVYVKEGRGGRERVSLSGFYVSKDPTIKFEVVKLGFPGHYTATHCKTSPPMKARKKETLQDTATHRNTPQHKASCTVFARD